MLQYFDFLNLESTTWDVIEFKILVLLVTVVIALKVAKYLFDRKDKQ